MVSSRRALWLAFLTAFVTLFTQVLVHRMISAKLLNNYAFLVISLTMLGFACSGALLTRWLGLALERFRETIAVSASLFSLSLLLASYAFYHSTASAQMVGSRPQFVLMLLRWVPLSLLYAIPFAFCGAILGILLAAPSLPTRRIYCFDLLGSAAGAFAVIPAIRYLGVETSCLLACGLLVLGALWIAPPRGRVVWLLAGGSVAVTLLAGFDKRFFDLYYPDGTMLAAGRDAKSGLVVERVLWDPVARIEMSRLPSNRLAAVAGGYPCLVGTNQAFHDRFRRMLTQNNYAFTFAVDYDGQRESLTGIEETIYAAAYQAGAAPDPRVLVVGVGGGFDILNALYFRASEVTGVEINQATVTMLTRTYRDYFRNWVEDPRVKLVSGEGRHFLATTSRSYDVIQLSGVDSYSGTAAAAHVFSENYLYTSEAWDIYLSHLTEQGIVNMMRLEFIPPREMLRALTTAVAALRRAGVADPAKHIVMLAATNEHFTALLVKRTPFRSEERDRLIAWAETSPFFKVSAAPGLNEAGQNAYQAFLTLNDPRREAGFIAAYPHDISPANDNRPFFFKYSFWWHLFPSSPWIWATVPVMEYSVLMLLLLSGLAAILCVYLPLRFLVARHQSATHPGRYATFFAGTGIGYLAIEIALLQKFGLFLGHPNYALSVVLAALLLTTGLGSLFSERIVSLLGQLRFVAYLLAAVVLLEYGLLLPWLPRGLALPFAAKTALVFALIAPIGACLGVFVPSAIEQLKRQAPAAVPWAWGVNGIFSVVAPVIAVAFSMSWGINALLIASIPIYLVVGWSLPELPAPPAPEPTPAC